MLNHTNIADTMDLHVEHVDSGKIRKIRAFVVDVAIGTTGKHLVVVEPEDGVRIAFLQMGDDRLIGLASDGLVTLVAAEAPIGPCVSLDDDDELVELVTDFVDHLEVL